MTHEPGYKWTGDSFPSANYQQYSQNNKQSTCRDGNRYVCEELEWESIGFLSLCMSYRSFRPFCNRRKKQGLVVSSLKYRKSETTAVNERSYFIEVSLTNWVTPTRKHPSRSSMQQQQMNNCGAGVSRDAILFWLVPLARRREKRLPLRDYKGTSVARAFNFHFTGRPTNICLTCHNTKWWAVAGRVWWVNEYSGVSTASMNEENSSSINLRQHRLGRFGLKSWLNKKLRTLWKNNV